MTSRGLRGAAPSCGCRSKRPRQALCDWKRLSAYDRMVARFSEAGKAMLSGFADAVHLWLGRLLDWVESLGYWGIIVGLAVEVIPSEIVLSFGGYLVSQGRITFAGAVVCGTIGAMLQQWILYAIGRYGGRPFLLK